MENEKKKKKTFLKDNVDADVWKTHHFDAFFLDTGG